jgi:integrating conjugative element protein (TIGR03749 family)
MEAAMRNFSFNSPFLAAAMRAAIRPSDELVRTLVTLMTAAIAAAICLLCLHPLDSMAEPVPADSAASAASAPAVEPALKLPASRPDTIKAAPASQRKAAASARRPAQGGPIAEATRQETGSTERLVWDKAPLQVALGIGPDRERSITFPAQMHIGVPQEVAQLLRVQTVGRTSYVTALAPFPRARVVAEDRTTGSVILLDLSAAIDNTSTLPVTIVVPSASEPRPQGRNADDEERETPVDMVTLTRFAAQQMYAPRRLTGAHPAIRRVLVNRSPLNDLYAGGGVRGVPAGQWRGDEFYVTAVVLQNLRAQPVELSPLDVRGRWRAITFQHGRLLGRGTEADTTVVYLVCDRPFDSCR